MRKILPIVIVVLSVVAIFAVPVFADSLISGVPNADGYMELPYLPDPGRYFLSAEIAGPDDVRVSVSHVVEFEPLVDGVIHCTFPYAVDDEHSIDCSIAIGPLNEFNSDLDSDSICAVFHVGGAQLDLVSFALSPVPPDSGSAVEQVTGIFTKVSQWFGSAMSSVESIFWNAENSALTTIGTLLIMGLAVSLAMLLLNIVKDFLRFR